MTKFKNKVLIRTVLVLLALVSVVFISGACEQSQAGTAKAYVTSPDIIESGRYLVTIGGCNDCHTAGYIQSNGKMPESEWLTGSPVGFRGPWGTTYAANLRLTAEKYTEEQWVEMCRTRETMPPMPWLSLNRMSDQDLKAVYRFIKSLGIKGSAAPITAGPGMEPETPYIIFEPVHMERLSNTAK